MLGPPCFLLVTAAILSASPTVRGEEGSSKPSDFSMDDSFCETAELSFEGGKPKVVAIGMSDAQDPLLRKNVGKSPCNFNSHKKASELKCLMYVGETATASTFYLQNTETTTGDGFLTFMGYNPSTLTTSTVHIWWRVSGYLLEQTTLVPNKKLIRRRSCNGHLSFPK